jgi:hypothetical protein
MRNWLWVGSLTVALGGVGGYWYFTAKPIETAPLHGSLGNTTRLVNAGNHDDAEFSDAIEPLVVDRGITTGVQTVEPPTDEGPMPRVVLEAWMKQPPRPDAESGGVPRMPYADEEEILGLTRPPLQRILEDGSPLKIFEELEKAKPAEESGNPETKAPAMEYHHHPMHCPYTGGCPAPYPYRTVPRD